MHPPAAHRGAFALSELAGVTAFACGLTAAVAWPVVLSPAERIYGDAIVGAHHDPFTVIRQIAGAGPSIPYVQPVTDGLGWLLARVLHPVTAYNVLVLSSLPLTAAATYALGRYLALPRLAALASAVFFAFAPIHLAHAAYHPHVAQTHWLALYLLAIFALIDRPTAWRSAAFAAAAAGLALSNFYAGLMAAILTPILLPAYWRTSARSPPARHIAVVAGLAAALSLAAGAAAAVVAPGLVANRAQYGFPSSDAALYSARWWSYFVPPVSHPLLGSAAADVHARYGVGVELLEQQVYVSFAVLLLGSVAGLAACLRWREEPWLRPALAMWLLGIAAAFVSIGPSGPDCPPGSWVPACGLHDVLPMFRSYARFAFAAHLAIALAAGFGLAYLAGRGRAARAAAVGLAAIAVFEYWPLPARARDVLPTGAHRFLAKTPATGRALDCVTLRPGDVHLPWLMQDRITFLDSVVPTCRDPDLGPRLAALGYRHALLRLPDRAGAQPFLDDGRSGLTLVADFGDARLYAVRAAVPPIAVFQTGGFFDYEQRAAEFWRWMGAEGRWQVRNTTPETRAVTLELVLESVHEPRRLAVTLDGGPAGGTVDVAVERASYKLGPWLLTPGTHTLVFSAQGRPFRPSAHGVSADDRELTVAFHRISWISDDDIR
jgi:hypothetical protein